MFAKYWAIISNEFKKQLNYRFYIISYAGGNFFELLAQVVVWSSIFKTVDTVSGYEYRTMISYVIIGWVFRFLTTNYDYERIIQKDIHLGRLSNYIVKPIDYFKYTLFNSIGRNLIAFVVILLQALVWILIFNRDIIFEAKLDVAAILLVFFILSYLVKFYFSSLIGFIGFWTTEVNGASYSLNIVVKFLSGGFFPIDLLSSKILAISYLFPFIYTFFVPTQIMIGRISASQGIRGVLIMAGWVIILHFITRFLWKKGLKKYESAGI